MPPPGQLLPPSAWNWSPPEPVLNPLLTAFLTTLLAYELSASVTDLLQGLKPPGTAPQSALALQLICDDASPHTLLHALRARPPERARTRLVLLALFAAPALANLLAVALTLETDGMRSFRAVGFQPVALGVLKRPYQHSLSVPSHPGCNRFVPPYRHVDTPVAMFFLCSGFMVEYPYPAPGNATVSTTGQMVVDTRADDDVLVVDLIMPQLRYQLTLYTDLRLDGRFYRLRHRVTTGDTAKLFLVMQRFLHKHCVTGYRSPPPMKVEPSRDRFVASQPATCANYTESLLQRTVDTALGHFGLIPAESFDVMDLLTRQQNATRSYAYLAKNPKRKPSGTMAQMVFGSNPFKTLPKLGGRMHAAEPRKRFALQSATQVGEYYSSNAMEGSNSTKYISVDDFPIVRRRSVLVGFPLLSALVVAVIVLRLVARLFSYNDLYVGLETVLKDQVGVFCCDSALQCDREVRYEYQVEVERAVKKSITSFGFISSESDGFDYD